MGNTVMDRKPEVQELSAAEVDQVTGGMIITPFVVAAVRAALKSSQADAGQNDPAQMFQQIMQQMTQG